MEQTLYFEDYQIGDVRTTHGRTITETDFVVLGSEPKVPTMTEEELQDPVQKDRFEKARAALDAYNKVREDAIQRGIPIVNQNRFLYYIGFYDQRRR